MHHFLQGVSSTLLSLSFHTTRVNGTVLDIQGIAEHKHEIIAAIVHIIFEASIKGSVLEEATMSLTAAGRKQYLTEKEGKFCLALCLPRPASPVSFTHQCPSSFDCIETPVDDGV